MTIQAAQMKQELLDEVPIGRRPEALRKIEALCRLVGCAPPKSKRANGYDDVLVRLHVVARYHAGQVRYGGASADMHMRYETTCEDARRDIGEYRTMYLCAECQHVRQEFDALFDALRGYVVAADDETRRAKFRALLDFVAKHDQALGVGR